MYGIIGAVIELIKLPVDLGAEANHSGAKKRRVAGAENHGGQGGLR